MCHHSHLSITVAQVVLTRLGDPGYTISGDLTLSMYTASGWVAVLAGIVNLILYMPAFFKEINIADREARNGEGKVTAGIALSRLVLDLVSC